MEEIPARIRSLSKGEVNESRVLTDLLHDCCEGVSADEREDRAFHGGNERWEGEVSPSCLVCSNLKAVLKDAVDNSADTEGWLDDAGSVLLLVLGLLSKLKSNKVLAEFDLLIASNLDSDFTSLL